jgi:ABC-2 type transport system ATP-binding protein
LHEPSISIALEDLRREYGDVTALHGLSLQVEPGQIVALLGPNGAGKSTLMKILTGFMSPTSGTARIAGHDTQHDAMAARQHIGYLPEHVPLYEDMLVHDYLTFMAKMRGVPRSTLATRLAHTIEVTGLTHKKGSPIASLSKGYRQRVGLAQAIVHEPHVLVLDEPTTGLDPNQVREVRDVIRRLGQQRTVLFSTHIMQEVAAVCDRVLILRAGRLMLDATIAELDESAGGRAMLPGHLEQLFYTLTAPTHTQVDS